MERTISKPFTNFLAASQAAGVLLRLLSGYTHQLHSAKLRTIIPHLLSILLSSVCVQTRSAEEVPTVMLINSPRTAAEAHLPAFVS